MCFTYNTIRSDGPPRSVRVADDSKSRFEIQSVTKQPQPIQDVCGIEHVNSYGITITVRGLLKIAFKLPAKVNSLHPFASDFYNSSFF